MRKMFGLLLQNSAQTLFAYSILITVVIIALIMMERYLRRGIQSGVKIAADEIGLQQDSLEKDSPYWVGQRVLSTAEQNRVEDLTGKHTLNMLETSETLYRERIELRNWEKVK